MHRLQSLDSAGVTRVKARLPLLTLQSKTVAFSDCSQGIGSVDLSELRSLLSRYVTQNTAHKGGVCVCVCVCGGPGVGSSRVICSPPIESWSQQERVYFYAV